MSFVKIWVHAVWGTKHREPVLEKSTRIELFRHMKKNADEKGLRLNFINGIEDHVHALLQLTADLSVGRTMQLLKGEASFWANQNHLLKNGNLAWADEYYAVSVSESQVERVRDYIRHQEAHHRQKSFAQECEEFTVKYGFARMSG